jgi:hypothetical protein
MWLIGGPPRAVRSVVRGRLDVFAAGVFRHRFRLELDAPARFAARVGPRVVVVGERHHADRLRRVGDEVASGGVPHVDLGQPAWLRVASHPRRLRLLASGLGDDLAGRALADRGLAGLGQLEPDRALAAPGEPHPLHLGEGRRSVVEGRGEAAEFERAALAGDHLHPKAALEDRLLLGLQDPDLEGRPALLGGGAGRHDEDGGEEDCCEQKCRGLCEARHPDPFGFEFRRPQHALSSRRLPATRPHSLEKP